MKRRGINWFRGDIATLIYTNPIKQIRMALVYGGCMLRRQKSILLRVLMHETMSFIFSPTATDSILTTAWTWVPSGAQIEVDPKVRPLTG